MIVLRAVARYGVLPLTILALSCDDGGTDPEPEPVLRAADGTLYTATVGRPIWLVVRLTRDGDPVAGANVTWSVTAGGGSIDPATSTTNAQGHAYTTWTLGPTVGTQSAEATSSGVGRAVSFLAHAVEIAPDPTPPAVEVAVVDNAFRLPSVRIAAGDSVTWTWRGTGDHNVTFLTGPSSPNQTTGSFSRTFDEVGEYGYLCTIHGPPMTGTVKVISPWDYY